MKVGLFAPSAYIISGVATFINGLLPALRRGGCEAQLLLVSGPKFHDPASNLEVHPDANVALVHTSTATAESRRRAIHGVLARARLDLALSFNVPDLVATIADMRRRGEPTPRVAMTIHGLDQNLFADVNHFAQALDGVICTNRLSCTLAEYLGGIDPKRVHYASYGIASSESEDRSDRDQAPGALRLLYVGRLDDQQKRILDVAAIARAAAHHTAVRLTVAGDGPSREEFFRALADAPAELEVNYLGRVDSALLPKLYAQSDALLITSLSETGPQVVWEAMASSLPVVTSRFIGSGLERALVHDSNVLFFEIGDTQAAAQCCLRLQREPALRDTLIANGLDLVKTRYSMASFENQWNSALRQIMESEPASAMGYAPRPAGRLDRLLGVQIGENLRQWMRRRPYLVDGGSEWPSAFSSATSDQAFWQFARACDRGVLPDTASLSAMREIA